MPHAADPGSVGRNRSLALSLAARGVLDQKRDISARDRKHQLAAVTLLKSAFKKQEEERRRHTVSSGGAPNWASYH